MLTPAFWKSHRALFGSLFLLALIGCKPPASQSGTTNNPPATYRPNREQTTGESRRSRPRGAEDQNASFDYYLLTLSGAPEFCHSHPAAAECAEHRAFTLHGLWPQRLSGGYPEHCSDQPGPQDPSRFRDLYPDASLLRHEWQTHGTCSGLDPDTFFDKARSATNSLHIPAQLTGLDHQISLPPDALLSLFLESNPSLPRASLALSCGNNFLTAVEVCLDRQLHPISCGPIRSCRANIIRIPPVQP